MGLETTTGAFLVGDQIDRYRTLGAFGMSAWQSHAQLRAMLLARLGPRCANYFARPVHDALKGELRWYAELPGQARAWNQIPPGEQHELRPILDEVDEELTGFVRDLRTKSGSQPGGAGAYASLLEQAMKVPTHGDVLFFVGKQPVIAFYGFETLGSGSVDVAAVPAASPAVNSVHVPEANLRLERPWWWWLLLLFALLVLILVLATGMRACMNMEAPALVTATKTDSLANREPLVNPAPPNTRDLLPRGELNIPPGALQKGDLSFLQGLWHLGDGPLDAYDGSPKNVVGKDRLTMQFGRSGEGHRYGTERVRRGKQVADCVGEARATTDGFKLNITLGRCNSPSGPSMSETRMECLNEGARETVCYVLNNDGHRWKAPMRRLQ